MKYCTLIISAFLLMFSTSTEAAHLSESLLVTARLSGSQEVPMVSTNATGVASFRLNDSKDTMCIDIIAAGLSGAITGAHVHEGAMGTNGGVVLNLTNFINGNRIRAVITGTDLTAEKIGKYLSGQYYVNIHTEANASGEIRGQLKLETDKGFQANLDAGQQVHTVVSSAKGLGAFTVSLPQQKLEVKMITTDLSGAITAAHLHYGKVGVAGGVAVNLSSMIDGNAIVGTVDISAVAGLMDSLMAGKVYINVHTAANASGEIRGQLMTNSNLVFDGMMDVNQQTQAVVGSMARGVVIVEIAPTLDTVWTHSLVDSLSGAITGAHLHDGGVGVSGGVLVNLTTGIMFGNEVNAMATIDVSLTADLEILNKLLTGNVYMNAHTTMNAAGEARGQLSRIVREGYTISLDGVQAMTMTSGEGVGIVSIDRSRSNAHYMIVTSGLSGAITSAHFHNAEAGVSGGVIYDLSGSFGLSGTFDGAFGYWTDLDVNTAFAAANELMFRHDEVYVNIHTMANAAGEIRGQVLREGMCSNAATGIDRTNIFEEVRIFPNPASTQLTLSVDLKSSFDGNVVVTNTLGQVMMVEQVTSNTDLQNYSLNIQGLSNGLYFLTIHNDEYEYTTRFIKN
ncbi:MAG: CHRD domain-containing protein [Saprospiraceae bacterium]